MLYCSSVCALSVLCDKLFTVARYARFEKKASEIVCMSCLQQERYQLRCGSLQGGKQQTQMYRKAVHMKQTVARLSEGESHITLSKESRE